MALDALKWHAEAALQDYRHTVKITDILESQSPRLTDVINGALGAMTPTLIREKAERKLNSERDEQILKKALVAQREETTRAKINKAIAKQAEENASLEAQAAQLLERAALESNPLFGAF